MSDASRSAGALLPPAHRDGSEWQDAPPAPRPERRLTLAVFKFASCDGCQLSLLGHEDQLLTLAQQVQIANFAEMSSAVLAGPYDIVLVEGSVTTPSDVARLQEIRARAGRLIAIGACATAGGIQALRNFADEPELARHVYPHPEYLATLATSTPISDHVEVDLEVHGCPVDRNALIEVIAAALVGRKPLLPSYAVCEECKHEGRACILVSAAQPCLGPVTRAGCGALCPGVGRACFGCFGPAESANPTALARRLASIGASELDLTRRFRLFTAAAPAFAAESARHEHR